MELALEVERDGTTQTVGVSTKLVESVDTFRVVAICGVDPLTELAEGRFNFDAAKAILYVNLIRVLADGEPDWEHPPIDYVDFDLDWGGFTEYLTEPDFDDLDLIMEPL